MALVVNTNVYSLNAQKNLLKTQGTLQTSLQRLSSGLRINSAKDDASGLSTATTLTSQVRELAVRMRQEGDVISLAQVKEGALDEVTNIVQRMRELVIDGGSAVSTELTELASTASGILSGTNFGDTTVTFSGVYTGITATATASALSTALSNINTERATLGAQQNAAESRINNYANSIENVSAARSRVLDADFAAETANLTRAQILQQAGVAMVSQANQIPQAALGLLQ